MSNIIPESCQVDEALSILFGKWKPIIMLHLMASGTMRYGELLKKLPKITSKVLASQLRELEEKKLIKRVVYPQAPPKVEYSITDYGMTLKPILDAMNDWGENHAKVKQREEVSEKK
ncbi:winged helix-turn-helix transcriptional regulator [Piscibacillus halophilus]|uniref:winged helix-turn-helix transcriptional regulator n=1 Tax=Piscibacillus halophilus TaxID=571933 RepID=UPI00158A4A74|nr:helix-turn-helix domain-containing protein [Piscibacillus halophilus]